MVHYGHMTKGNYVDGFVFIVPKRNIAAYKKMASEGARMWKKFGALDYKECMGDDLKPHKGMAGGFTFPKITKAKSSETVWFSYIVFRNKKHRDEVNKKVMAYFEKKYTDKSFQDMPNDMKKMAYGGFSVVVS